MRVINNGSNRAFAATYSKESLMNYLSWSNHDLGNRPHLQGDLLTFPRGHYLFQIKFTQEELFNFKMDFAGSPLFRVIPDRP